MASDDTSKVLIGVIAGSFYEWKDWAAYGVQKGPEADKRTTELHTQGVTFKYIGDLSDSRGLRFDCILRVGTWMHTWDEPMIDQLYYGLSRSRRTHEYLRD